MNADRRPMRMRAWCRVAVGLSALLALAACGTPSPEPKPTAPLALATATATVPIVTPVPPRSLLVNSDFARDVSGWTIENCGQAKWVADGGHDALGALQLVATGCGLSLTQTVTVSAGRYRISGWVSGQGRGLGIFVDGKAVAEVVASDALWAQAAAVVSLDSGSHTFTFVLDQRGALYDDFTLTVEP